MEQMSVTTAVWVGLEIRNDGYFRFKPDWTKTLRTVLTSLLEETPRRMHSSWVQQVAGRLVWACYALAVPFWRARRWSFAAGESVAAMSAQHAEVDAADDRGAGAIKPNPGMRRAGARHSRVPLTGVTAPMLQELPFFLRLIEEDRWHPLTIHEGIIGPPVGFLCTDASGLGAGLVYYRSYDETEPTLGAAVWSRTELQLPVGQTEATHINLLELQAVLWAIRTLDLRTGLLQLFVDSQVVFWLLRNWHTGSDYLLPLLCQVHQEVVSRGLGLSVHWIRSENNPADVPSRLDRPVHRLEEVRPEIHAITASVAALIAVVEPVAGAEADLFPGPPR